MPRHLTVEQRQLALRLRRSSGAGTGPCCCRVTSWRRWRRCATGSRSFAPGGRWRPVPLPGCATSPGPRSRPIWSARSTGWPACPAFTICLRRTARCAAPGSGPPRRRTWRRPRAGPTPAGRRHPRPGAAAVRPGAQPAAGAPAGRVRADVARPRASTRRAGPAASRTVSGPRRRAGPGPGRGGRRGRRRPRRSHTGRARRRAARLPGARCGCRAGRTARLRGGGFRRLTAQSDIGTVRMGRDVAIRGHLRWRHEPRARGCQRAVA